VIDSIWRPAIGARRFDHVTYSMLVKIADAKHGERGNRTRVAALPQVHDLAQRAKGQRNG
jgi:hypothetical protein